MQEKKEKLQKIRFPDKIFDYIIVHEDEESYLEGWMSLEGSFEELLENLRIILESAWGSKYTSVSDYKFYYIDVLNNYNLIYFTNNKIFEEIKKLNEIFIVILHEKIEFKIIQNIPVVYDWFMNSY
jgi:hypothetical protein